VRPLPMADGERADAAGALGGGPALPRAPVSGLRKDAATPGDATLALALAEAAGSRTGAGVWPRGCFGG
jgi:hypothetical protein